MIKAWGVGRRWAGISAGRAGGVGGLIQREPQIPGLGDSLREEMGEGQ